MMPNYNQKSVITLCVLLFILMSVSINNRILAQTTCTLGNFTGAYTIPANAYPYYSAGSGVTVSVVNVGVPTLNNFDYSCNGQVFSTVSPAFWINAAAPTQSLTFNFSEPVCAFSVVVNGTNLNEEFYFATATGSIALSDYCTTGFVAINGGTGLRCSQSATTGTLITVNNPVGSTSYVLTHSGTGSGSRYALKDCFVVCSPLPIELVSSEVKCEANSAKINWQTAAEINNDYFAIWRSFDGENFSQIATIEGQSNSNTLTNYEWHDPRLFEQTVYYRLSQTDLDGVTTEYKTHAFLGCNDFNSLVTVEKFDVVIVEGESIKKVEIYDQMGRVLLEFTNINQEEVLRLNPNVKKGIYIVKISHRNGLETTENVYLEK